MMESELEGIDLERSRCGYKLIFKHIKGNDNILADFLSRESIQ